MPSGTLRSDASKGALWALLAAGLFGASAPLGKVLLAHTSPIALAALLYLGAGIALTVARWASSGAREAALRRSDGPWIAATLVAGGVLGPLLMLTGLHRISGVTGALLLNLEMPFTVLLAVLLFREHLGGWELTGGLFIGAAAVFLGMGPTEGLADGVGVAAVAGACLCWAVDNNLTARISLRDPVAVAQWKTLGAGLCSLGLCLPLGASVPTLAVASKALALGALSYGLSLVLTLRALRVLGAARQSAYFAAAPFAGALLSVPLLGDSLGPAEIGAATSMATGVALLLRARHAHTHSHAELAHDHLHVHDEHHQHAHAEPSEEPHAHPHRHEALRHEHAHVSDAHHRHKHGRAN
jgi:drug/metabolite transporter (DMT)-like permease